MDSSMPRIKELHLKNKDKLGNRKNHTNFFCHIKYTLQREDIIFERQDT
jgi:hypothetical protein